MRNSPGFLPYLQEQLCSLAPKDLARINDPAGLDLSNLISQVARPQDHSVYDQYESEDVVVKNYSEVERSSLVSDTGRSALMSDEIAYCILAGDDKALKKIPGIDVTLLAIKLLQSQGMKHVWIMTSPSNHTAVESYLKELSWGSEVKLFQQFESVNLLPDNQLYLKDSSPSFYTCGSGDAIPALIKKGILGQFLNDGGKHIMFVNVDNVLAEPDINVLGQHIISQSPVTCELVLRENDDLGGVLCNHMGFDQVVEQYRFMTCFDSGAFKWLNTNTFLVRADLDFSTVRWKWHRLKKECNGQLVIQFERLIQDLTSTFQTQYIEVPREERFMPIKTHEDLENASRIFKKI